MAARTTVAALGALLLLVTPAAGQDDILSGQPLRPIGGNLGAGPPQVVKVSAQFTAGQDGKGKISVAATMDEGWHIYSLTQQQPGGGPIRSKIKLDKSQQFRVGEFTANSPPITTVEKEYKDLPLETHEGTVTFTAPIELASGVDPRRLAIGGALYAQACSDRCLPPQDYKFTAKLAGTSDDAASRPPSPNAAGPTTKPAAAEPISQYVKLSGRVQRSGEGQSTGIRLILTLDPQPGWYVYALSDKDTDEVGVPHPTLIALTSSGGLQAKKPVANSKPVPIKSADGKQVLHYEGPVEFSIDIDSPPADAQRQYPIAGIIGFQSCHEAGRCDLPRGAKFSATISPAALARGPVEVKFHPAKFGDAVAAVGIAPSELSLSVVLGLSILGGLILNLMPCVLPVIGLKVLTFVQQAGHSRGQILALNLWYSAGVMAVFMVLASMAAAAAGAAEGWGWGTQFQSATFNVVMASVVLVMALSFLGVWEIPIPGFVGSSKASDLANQEGVAGAFSKGVLSTILATPCSGPGLGVLFAYAVKQPPHVIYAVFACVGLGMALPYLFIGAFPVLIRLLPKPGAWMDTFKQSMGFVLLATILVIVQSIPPSHTLFTLGLLLGLAAGCWWIGRCPITAELPQKLRVWLQGTSFATVVGLVLYGVYLPHEVVVPQVDRLFVATAALLALWSVVWWIGRTRDAPKLLMRWALAVVLPAAAAAYGADRLLPRYVLPWQPFSRAKLEHLTSEGTTVLVDFSAEWCLTCKYNLKFAVNTQSVRDLVAQNGVVPLLADWTDGSADVTQALQSLDSFSIPVLAIFPGGGGRPIVLRDLVGRNDVLAALAKAGPSRTAGRARTTAMHAPGK